jgi:hypothetical protein
VPILAVADLQRLLRHDRRRLECWVDQMDRDSGLLDAELQCVGNGVGPRELRKQGMVDLHDPVLVGLYGRGSDDRPKPATTT